MIMPLVRVAARAAPSLRRGRCQPPVPPSPSLSASTLLVSPSDRFHDARAPRTDGRRRHQHQQRPLSAHARPSRPLLAQPHHHVAGATSEQVEASQAMKDYYAANFGGDWRDRPDVIVAGELEDDAPRLGDDDEEDEEEEEEEEEENPSVIRLPEELTKRNIRPLVAYLRAPHEEGSRACRKLRYPGDDNKSKFPLVPGILHGSDPTKGTLSQDPSSRILVKTPWFEVQRELDRYHRGITGSFESRVYALTVFPGEEASLDHHRGRQPRDQTEWRVNEDASALIKIPAPKPPLPPPRTPVEGMENILVVPDSLQMHPVANSAFCVNFLRYHPKRPLMLPLRLMNEEESPVLRRGGFVNQVHWFVECFVEDGAPIPEFVGVECTGLKAKDVVRRDRLILPEGTAFHERVPDDFLVGTVFGVRGATAAEGEGGEEAATAA